jgi:hypothetical protein
MDTQNRQFWLGIGLGILGLVPPVVEYAKRDFQLAALFVFILLLMFLWFYFSLRSGHGPHYETLLMKKVLTIKDPQGKLAEARCEQRIRAHYGNLQGIWRKNNVVDGSMSDFRVDGKPPDEIDKLGSNMSFYKRFTIPLSKGEERDVIWTFQATDSLLNAEEAFLHDTTSTIRQLEPKSWRWRLSSPMSADLYRLHFMKRSEVKTPIHFRAWRRLAIKNL